MRTSCKSFAILLLAMMSVSAVAQTLSPPVAEYRGKVSGMFELRNDSDEPLAAILEVSGFSVDTTGNLLYADVPAGTQVDFGANSFLIQPHQTHMVFYKATTTQPATWFTIKSTLTKAKPAPNQMRINFLLPHVVYAYQKAKLKKEDIKVEAHEQGGTLNVRVTNDSQKLGRVESVKVKGFEKEAEFGGFPMFPNYKREIALATGAKQAADATVVITFQDGFSLSVPVGR